ncbi:hypothetical protein ACLRGF_07955 [Mycetocola zhadangensis]|uniref:hypothetical protein n=1 Tax=Mycetocola zhadangensis TaxID=1164595 RepID=UPI003A4E6318
MNDLKGRIDGLNDHKGRIDQLNDLLGPLDVGAFPHPAGFHALNLRGERVLRS